MRTDALIVAAGCIVGTNRNAFPTRAHFAASAGMAAATTVFVVALRVDAVIIALGLGLGALTLAKLAGAPRITGMATGTTVVGVGSNLRAHTIAADLVGGPQAAIPVLAVVQPRLKRAVRVHPTAEARDEHLRIVANAVAQRMLVGDPLAIGLLPAFGHVAASRSGPGSADRTPGQGGNHATQQTLQHTAARGRSPEGACQVIKTSFFHRLDPFSALHPRPNAVTRLGGSARRLPCL